MFTPVIRRRSLALVLCGLLLPVLSCSSDEETVITDPGNATLDASGTVGADGGIIASEDGRLTLTIPPGALANDTEIVITEVTADELVDVPEDMDVIYALTVEPANLDLAAPMTLELLYTEEQTKRAGDKRTEDRKEIGFAVTVLRVEDLEDEVPDLADIWIVPQQKHTIRSIVDGDSYQDFTRIEVLRGPQGVLFGRPSRVIEDQREPIIVLGFDQNVPDTVEENSPFTVEASFDVSGALDLDSSIRYIEVPLENITTNLEDDDIIVYDVIQEPDSSTLYEFGLNYGSGSAGSATWDLAVGCEWQIQAAVAFPSAPNLPPIWGNVEMELHYDELALFVDEAVDGAELGEGLYDLQPGVEGPFPIRGAYNKSGFPYSNTLAVSAANATTIYSLSASNPAAPVFTGLQIPDLQDWGCFLIGAQSAKADENSLAMVAFGPAGARITSWLPEEETFGFTGAIEFQSIVTDAQPFGGDPESGGFVYVVDLYGAVRMLEFNSASGFYDINRQFSNFPEAPGTPYTAAVRPGAGAVVVTEGSPGKIYHHDLADLFAPAVAIGDAGNSPRRIRTAGNLAVVSNFASDNLTILSWSPEGVVSVVGSVAVGDGPVGIDALELSSGNIAVVSAGFNDNTSTVTVLDPTGSVVSNTTSNLPAGALAPGHAFWLRGAATHYGVTCNASGNLAVIDPGLD